MNIKNILIMTATGLMLAACQSNTYHINGKVEGIENGDTLFLTTDMEMGTPMDTIVVENGTFSVSGETENVQLAMIYSARQNEINVSFFLEPGDISIQLSQQPGLSRVSGTNCNEEWQILCDSVIAIGKQINQIAEHIYGNTVSQEEQEAGMKRIDELNAHFAEVVIKTAEDNIKNEFGCFLVTYYPEEMIDNATRLRLIEKLPDEMRERPAVKQWEQSIAKAAKTAEGSMLPDFSQPTPDGSMLNIKEEIANHKVTIIDFWASWCGPCRQEMPFMIQIYEEMKDKGLGIVGVSLDNDASAWNAAISQLKLPWPQMSDLKGWENAAAQQFNINSIPHTIVVDQQGKILRRGLRGEELKEFVTEQLKK